MRSTVGRDSLVFIFRGLNKQRVGSGDWSRVGRVVGIAIRTPSGSEWENTDRRRIHCGRRSFGKKGLHQSLPGTLEGVIVDVQSLQSRQHTEPAREGMEFVPSNTDGMKLVEVSHSIRERDNASGVGYENTEVYEISEENRQNPERIRSDIKFFQICTNGKDRRKKT